ncbi:ATP-citrate synthase, partial [Caligus rogercresseyi]
AFIADIDAKTGASLKLTILNPKGRIWTMVAGGGASVIYADTVSAYGGASELANYGEYSGAPSEQQTYDYAKTILSLMTKEQHDNGKVLIIGGGIANFTNVAATFKGIVRAIEEYQNKLKEFNITIFVRRAGPNYQEGLRVMREVGKNLEIPIHSNAEKSTTTANFLLPSSADIKVVEPVQGSELGAMFSSQTRAIVWGLQIRAVQGMVDFDYVCQRPKPSVACMVYPMVGGDSKQNFYWGHKEILIPVYKSMDDAMKKHPDASVMVNFASLRSAYDSTLEAMEYPQIKSIVIIAEGIPENFTRKIIVKAKDKNVNIIGPATVGGIKPGCFKIGNSGGMMDNLLHSKLYRPGSVAYVSRSGGMSNELNNIVSQKTNGVYEGVAIGGDRYPVTTFLDHLLRFENIN